MNNSIKEISKRIIPLSAFNSLNENGFDVISYDIDENSFYDIVASSDPLTSVNLLRSFYMYYKIYLNKYFIRPLLTSDPLKIEEILENEKQLKDRVQNIINSLERKIIH
ncbi:hypothetical protein [Spiroplasma diminutum]|uniref:Uncharacterized protein n=1 Tax=Spiroplasma diminutum CUAS-1 TaxID=1276221 RepID=S5MK46_9MOLU|nr:hypothetical protein [Spiroplasma diminutum]AGR42340.1 hypothetical protein SDIMI_v3c06360 [Spiroplasma diminutum CUAS-1]